MKVLYIMPWFTRPSAMSKHCKIFLSNAISLGINPIVVSLNGKDDFKENQKSNFSGSCAESDNAVMAAVGLCRNIAGN